MQTKYFQLADNLHLQRTRLSRFSTSEGVERKQDIYRLRFSVPSCMTHSSHDQPFSSISALILTILPLISVVLIIRRLVLIATMFLGWNLRWWNSEVV